MKTKWAVSFIVVGTAGVLMYIFWPNRAVADPITGKKEVLRNSYLSRGLSLADANTKIVTTGKGRF